MGLKPPQSCFMFQAKKQGEEEDAYVSWRERTIPVLARFFFNYSISVFVFYVLIVTHYINKVIQQRSWQGTWIGNLWDLGSIPRSPRFIHIFCFNIIACSVLSKHLPYSHNLSLPHIPWFQSKGPDLVNIIGISQQSHTLAKRSTRPGNYWARNTKWYLQLGTEPP